MFEEGKFKESNNPDNSHEIKKAEAITIDKKSVVDRTMFYEEGLTVKKITVLSMFAAISIILTRFFVIYPMPTVRIEFGNIPIMLAGLMFGPISGLIVGGVADFAGALLRGQGFDLVLMLSPMFMGFVAGLARSRILKKPGFISIAALTFCVNIIAKMIWTTYWLSVLYGKALMAILPARIIVYSIVPFVEASVLFALLSNSAFRKIVLKGEIR